MPVAALVPGFGGAIAPIGPSLVIGAFVFGIGMQLANGCGSGTLYTVGGGSGRMLVTLALFIVGSVIGSLHLPAFLTLGGIDPILASNYFGPWGGLAATLAEPGARGVRRSSRIARRRGASFMPRVASLSAPSRSAPVDRRVPRRPSSLERDLRLHGVGREACGAGSASIFPSAEFWQWAGPEARARANLILSDTSSLTDLGMILGAMAAAAARAVRAQPPGRRARSLAAALGGLLMGWGARIGFGCNIGAFVGGVASGSLHGWIWFAAALPRLHDRHQAASAVRPVARLRTPCASSMQWC